MSQGLKPSTDLSNRIARIYPSLSSGHRRAADFVLQNPLDVATMTIEGLAGKRDLERHGDPLRPHPGLWRLWRVPRRPVRRAQVRP